MRRVCVFAGSSPGASSGYAGVAAALAKELAARGLALVYGGARVGLMGTLADAALAAGAHVTGVIPESLVALEVAHESLPDLRIVASMHERKQVMADLADAFIALPGGLGTLEELFEILTWAQLGMHAKPCGILNVDGYYDALLAFLDRAVADRLVTPGHRAMLLVETEPAALLDRFAGYTPPPVEKWLDREET
ncbi:MAG TPA: TIGR00730 family Rossman fold protein [Myxococcota bacterium]|nr:TIGR00730 family Rossman fold protein [Myxococcota bacterium]